MRLSVCLSGWLADSLFLIPLSFYHVPLPLLFHSSYICAAHLFTCMIKLFGLRYKNCNEYLIVNKMKPVLQNYQMKI